MQLTCKPTWEEYRALTYARSASTTVCCWWVMVRPVFLRQGSRKSRIGSSKTHGEKPGVRMVSISYVKAVTFAALTVWFPPSLPLPRGFLLLRQSRICLLSPVIKPVNKLNEMHFSVNLLFGKPTSQEPFQRR